MSTNTLPMYSICPRLQGFNEDIFGIQGDDNPLSTSGIIKVTGFMKGKRQQTLLPTESMSLSGTMTECMCFYETVTRSGTTIFRI